MHEMKKPGAKHDAWTAQRLPVYLTQRDIEALRRIMAWVDRAEMKGEWPPAVRPGPKVKCESQEEA